MTIKKVRNNRWICGEWTITLSNGKIKGLYPKYYVSRGFKDSFHASTLKEAKEKIEAIERGNN